MFRTSILPLLAVAGVGLGIYAATLSSRVTSPARPVSEAPQPPYPNFVAGAGIVEANTENISIGTQVAGIVSKIYVKVGDKIKAGAPLFTIDERAQGAEVTTRRASLQITEAQLANAKYELQIAEGLTGKQVMSIEERDLRRYLVLQIQAQVAQAKAQLASAETDLDRLTTTAPLDGQVLQLKVHLGEFAPTGVLETPLLMLGNVDPLCVRVDFDENEAWRVRSDARAVGYLRGNKAITTPLKFVRLEPYVSPKKSLTGDSTERVDTRVLQVIYALERRGLPIHVGQQMDVFVEAPAHDNTSFGRQESEQLP
ncbi:MAG TPA: efflux RND transporter periplasmic adaptor subunit [Terrimicrobiaceae bacterium]